MPRSKFIIELKANLNRQDFLYLRLLYTPLVGTKAISLFELMYDYYALGATHNAYYDWQELALYLNLSEEQLTKVRFKLEAIGLIRVFEKSDNKHFIIRLNPPLNPVNFAQNSLLYKDFINKRGEIIFERILFATKLPSYAKDEFREVTLKYHDLFTLQQAKPIQSTQLMQLPLLSGVEEAKKALTVEQFVFYLTKQKSSPLQLNTFNKLRQKGFVPLALNELIHYSFLVNNQQIVANHIFVIGQDLMKQGIRQAAAVGIELKNAWAKRQAKTQEAPYTLVLDTQISRDDWQEAFELLGGN